MNRLILLLPFLLLSASAQAEDIYHLRRLSERELTRAYETLMLDACRHAEGVWQDSSTNPSAGYWGTGRSDQMNEGIRAISGMVLTCGALLKYSDTLSDADRRHYTSRATRAIRYAVSSHLTGTQKCTDGKPWGKHLASSLVPEGPPTGFPLYRLEWQSLGSLQRRLRNCMIGMRAEPFAYGAPEHVNLELFLKWRARGLTVETPAVRP